jgi:hypothetical protein
VPARTSPGRALAWAPPLAVALHHRRIRDPQLLGQVVHHQPRHIQRVLQEQPLGPHGPDLQGEPEPMAIRPAQRYQVPIDYLDNAVGASDVSGGLVLPGADREHCGYWRASFEQTLGCETCVEEAWTSSGSGQCEAPTLSRTP